MQVLGKEGCLILALLLNLSVTAWSAHVPPQTCASTREYVTVFEFFRANKDFGVNEEKARSYSDLVSKNCTGAAARFIQTLEMLSKSHVASADALAMALDLSGRSDETLAAFFAIFKTAFLKEYLDLTIGKSLDLAKKLTFSNLEIQNIGLVKEDFESVAEFCLKNDGFSFSREECTEMAAAVALAASRFEKPLSKSFVKLIEFIRDRKSAKDASKAAVEIIAYGTEAPENFMTAFQYAVSDSGLKLAVDKAHEFAMVLAKRSVQNLNEAANPGAKR